MAHTIISNGNRRKAKKKKREKKVKLIDYTYYCKRKWNAKVYELKFRLFGFIKLLPVFIWRGSLFAARYTINNSWRFAWIHSAVRFAMHNFTFIFAFGMYALVQCHRFWLSHTFFSPFLHQNTHTQSRTLTFCLTYLHIIL